MSHIFVGATISIRRVPCGLVASSWQISRPPNPWFYKTKVQCVKQPTIALGSYSQATTIVPDVCTHGFKREKYCSRVTDNNDAAKSSPTRVFRIHDHSGNQKENLCISNQVNIDEDISSMDEMENRSSLDGPLGFGMELL